MTSLRAMAGIARTGCTITVAVGCRSKSAGMSLENFTAGSGRTTPSPIASGRKSTPLRTSRPVRSIWRRLREIRTLAVIVYLPGIVLCFPPWNWQACDRRIWTLITTSNMTFPKPELTIGIVGAGAFAAFASKAFLQVPGIQIIAVADTNPTSARHLAGELSATAYSDYESMLRDGRINLVYVSTPPFLHYSQSKAALQ